MSKQKYNGYSNYATWRVMLEVFQESGYTDEVDHWVTPDGLRDYVEQIMEAGVETTQNLVFSYAMAFLNDVNWREIADAVNFDRAERLIEPLDEKTKEVLESEAHELCLQEAADVPAWLHEELEARDLLVAADAYFRFWIARNGLYFAPNFK